MKNTSIQTETFNKNQKNQTDIKIHEQFSQELSESHTNLPMQHTPHNHNANPEMLARFCLFLLPLTYQDWTENKPQPARHF